MSQQKQTNKTLTLVSCFYVLDKAKFPKETYLSWLTHFLQIFQYNPYIYLFLYTDSYSASFLPTFIRNIPSVFVIIKPLEQFYMYKYATMWRKNHEQNHALKMTTGWELNMLWSEKLWFLRDVIQQHHPNLKIQTPFYAWCDCGYFRNRNNDLHTGGGMAYYNWANPRRMQLIDKTKIHYSLINTNKNYIHQLKTQIQHKHPITRVPIHPIPPTQQSIGGGFCLLTPEQIDEWCLEYENKLQDYFESNTTVKDDQIILADCIFSKNENVNRFFLVAQNPNIVYDPWFVFQRFLF